MTKESFVEHLEQASRIVRSWPVWKQRVLGSTDSGVEDNEKIYIYIFENDVKYSPLAPLNGDLQAVEDGDLQVLRVKWLEEVALVEAVTGAGEWYLWLNIGRLSR